MSERVKKKHCSLHSFRINYRLFHFNLLDFIFLNDFPIRCEKYFKSFLVFFDFGLILVVLSAFSIFEKVEHRFNTRMKINQNHLIINEPLRHQSGESK
ncbi:MAG TPA: hypothetical protein DGG95_16605 [Cytophagales bacterium]|nr:hypothetical protein [Cytophagales bacterium]